MDRRRRLRRVLPGHRALREDPHPRTRRSDWFLGSVGYHVVAIVAAVVAAVLGVVHWAVVAVAVVILARAWGMPVSGAKRDKPWTPKQVGMLEGLITLVVAIAALL